MQTGLEVIYVYIYICIYGLGLGSMTWEFPDHGNLLEVPERQPSFQFAIGVLGLTSESF